MILEREKMAYQIEEKNPLPSRTPSALSCYALRLKPGQEIKECLLAFVKNENMKAPFVLSCVGSVSQATLRLANAVKDNTNEVRQHHCEEPKSSTNRGNSSSLNTWLLICTNLLQCLVLQTMPQ